ncbi:hypothetical protein KKF81_06495 [Candidatus Micrarchaeota archaeon]|nr:hypothetical protein [Candidatus Micrarchaeota archaeon]MBU1166577.1 hypothetical protein [Candidatus Micrarchaeota archaeon]MBU1887291.1 hypothetical protein [Candidatus Micrarchaeota archaeon]
MVKRDLRFRQIPNARPDRPKRSPRDGLPKIPGNGQDTEQHPSISSPTVPKSMAISSYDEITYVLRIKNEPVFPIYDGHDDWAVKIDTSIFDEEVVGFGSSKEGQGKIIEFGRAVLEDIMSRQDEDKPHSYRESAVSNPEKSLGERILESGIINETLVDSLAGMIEHHELNDQYHKKIELFLSYLVIDTEFFNDEIRSKALVALISMEEQCEFARRLLIEISGKKTIIKLSEMPAALKSVFNEAIEGYEPSPLAPGLSDSVVRKISLITMNTTGATTGILGTYWAIDNLILGATNGAMLFLDLAVTAFVIPISFLGGTFIGFYTGEQIVDGIHFLSDTKTKISNMIRRMTRSLKKTVIEFPKLLSNTLDIKLKDVDIKLLEAQNPPKEF